jgi:hypothetical protein
MTKLEELEAAWEAADDRAIAAYKAVATAEYAADAAEDAADEAWSDYRAELKKTQEENVREHR